MKLTLVSSSLNVGGAERVLSIIANYWAANGWEITILTLDDGYEPPFYDLDDRIDVRPLSITSQDSYKISLSSLKDNLGQIKILKQAIIASRPDVVISFVNHTNIMTLLACWGLKVKTIVSEHVNPTVGQSNKVTQLLQKSTYLLADLITVQTHAALAFFPSNRYNTFVIPNPVALLTSEPIESQFNTDDRHLLAIGKLSPQKGFDLAISAFAQVCDNHPDWTFTILGEGEMRGELENLLRQLGLEDRVFMPGVVKNVDAHLRKADIFLLSSRFEGFPVTLCEAMACGVPVIASNCLSGPREIIHDGIDGMLVAPNNVDALAIALNRLMADPEKRQYFSYHAPKVLDRFGVEPVMIIWNRAIDQVLNKEITGFKTKRKKVMIDRDNSQLRAY
jgi:GalNAc-alpha-(1->4)-GalNAc-alpha-(1->3)-diNAcBac-PP-undecaprenol alpha-1,4-N-acetyl-D-galactosaminyltransferase